MQKNRLFHILYYIIERGKVTAPELSEKFEVSIRTIYRDIDVLSGAGIPVYTTQGKDGGISILDDFVIEKSLFTKSEREQLLSGIQSIAMTGEEESTELLTKLSALFKTQSTSWIEVDFFDWNQNKPEQRIFNDAKIAILNHNVISFDYFSNHNKSANRQVQPYKLVFKSKNWYLYGFCLIRNDYRFFKLTRMKNFTIQAERFSPQSIPTVIEKQLSNQETTLVKLKFDKEAAFRVYDEFPDNISEDPDGNLQVQAKLPNSEMLYIYILSFGEHVEIIEPTTIRENFIEKLEQIKNKYLT